MNLEQTKPLARLDSVRRREAYKLATEQATGKELTTWDLEEAARRVAPKVVATHPDRRTKEQIEKTMKNRERRERKEEREQEKKDNESRAAWEKDIVAVLWLFKRYGGPTWQNLGTDVDQAIADVIAGEDSRPKVTLLFFQGGRLIAAVIFKDGSPVVVRRAEMEGGPKQ